MNFFVDLYFLCVDFMIQAANLLGITYRDANIIVLFGVIPVVLFFDLILLTIACIKKL